MTNRLNNDEARGGIMSPLLIITAAITQEANISAPSYKLIKRVCVFKPCFMDLKHKHDGKSHERCTF